MLKIGHVVTRPGKRLGDPLINIPVAEELETVPGIPTNQREVDWYAREYPLETVDITERPSLEWSHTMRYRGEGAIREIRKEHELVNRPLQLASRATADLEPRSEPTGQDVTELIRHKAKELGFLDVGFTAYDYRYDFQSTKGVARYPHAICLAFEQEYEPTQTIPSVPAEVVHFSTFRTMTSAALELGSYVRSLGYHAQVLHNSDSAGPVIPIVGCQRNWTLLRPRKPRRLGVVEAPSEG